MQLRVHTRAPSIAKKISKKKKNKTKELISELSQSLNTLFSENDEQTQNSIFSTSELVINNFKNIIQEKNVQYDKSINLPKIISWAYKQAKVCEICKRWENQKSLVACDICEDVFHSGCIKRKRVPQDWSCEQCIKQMDEKIKKKSSLLNHSFTIAKQEQICGKCKLPASAEQILKCLRCKQEFHSRCFVKQQQQATSTSSQSRFEPNVVCCFCYNQVICKVQGNNKLDKYFNKVTPQKKTSKNQFLLPNFAKNEDERKQLKETLFFALESQNIEFCDDLIYNQVPESENNSQFEPFLQQLEGDNLAIFEKFKMMTKDANYAPVRVVHDRVQGFVVKAFENIPAMTLICEYVGEVYRLRDQLFTKSDSMMTLLKTSRSFSTLVIIPDRYANLARYLSGINNANKKLKLKQNVQSIRYDINGKARVLLYAFRTIKAGEYLYYDYNAGGDEAYDTSNFV